MKAERIVFALSALLSNGCSNDPTGPSVGPGPGEPDPPEIALPALMVSEPIASSTRDGSPYVYVIDPDGTGLRPLAPGEAPAWSPEGGHLAYHREPEDGCRHLDCPHKIFVTDLLGARRQLVPDVASPAHPSYSDYDPAWSRTGGNGRPLREPGAAGRQPQGRA